MNITCFPRPILYFLLASCLFLTGCMETKSQIKKFIIVDIEKQELTLYLIDGLEKFAVKTYSVSTGKKGYGEVEGAGATPRGMHIIDEMFGEDAQINSVFVGREFTGEILTEKLYEDNPQRDWITSRIMWLKGVEDGFNLNNNVDTKSRYIYIHGTPDSEPMGIPKSHGCIRMRNTDVIDLFNRVEVGTPVLIVLRSKGE